MIDIVRRVFRKLNMNCRTNAAETGPVFPIDYEKYNKVAVVISNYSIGKSSPIICLLDFLSDHYRVDLIIKSVSYTNATVLRKKNINIIELKSDKGERSLSRLWSHIFGSSVPKSIPKRHINIYKYYFCFDPYGFILCKELFPDSKPFYYSLELCFRDDHFNMDYPEKVMNIERAEINNIKGLIIQSREREMLFRKEHNLSDEIPTFILPVTYQKPSVEDKSSLLKKKYNLANGTKIAIHFGGIQEYYSCIELALAFSRLDNWLLVFHGYYFGTYIEQLKEYIAIHKISNVRISDEVYDLIEEVDPLLMSCDIGIAWYNDVSINFTTAGRSSGKISSYLRFGLPVIAKKYQSTHEAIELTGCGVCVDTFEEISAAVGKIEQDYDRYSNNCRRVYDEVYWFDNYRGRLLEYIEQNKSCPK